MKQVKISTELRGKPPDDNEARKEGGADAMGGETSPWALPSALACSRQLNAERYRTDDSLEFGARAWGSYDGSNDGGGHSGIHRRQAATVSPCHTPARPHGRGTQTGAPSEVTRWVVRRAIARSRKTAKVSWWTERGAAIQRRQRCTSRIDCRCRGGCNHRQRGGKEVLRGPHGRLMKPVRTSVPST